MNKEIINIQLYNESKEVKLFEGFEYFKSGRCAKLYKKDDVLLKMYKYDCKYKFYLKKKIFKLLKELNIPNIVTLYEYYYSCSSTTNNFLPMDSYTMKYIEDDNINILDQPKEYLINIVQNLEDTCIALAKNKIKMHDVHEDNVILNRNGAKLVDIDTYDVYKLVSYKKILLSNKLELLHFLKRKIESDLKLKQIEFAFYKLDYLFRLCYDDELVTDVVKRLCTNDTVGKSLINKLNW